MSSLFLLGNAIKCLVGPPANTTTVECDVGIKSCVKIYCESDVDTVPDEVEYKCGDYTAGPPEEDCESQVKTVKES